MARGRPSTHDDSEYIEKRAKTPKFHDWPTKAECAAMKAPPKKGPLAKARLPMSAMSERIMLARPDGHFLNVQCDGFSPRKEYAYFGTASQVEALIRKNPEYADLRRVSFAQVHGIGTAKLQN